MKKKYTKDRMNGINTAPVEETELPAEVDEMAKPATEEPTETIELVAEEELEGDKFEHLPKKDALKLNEVAEYLDVEPQTVRVWMEHGYFEVEKRHGTLFFTTRSIKNFRLKSGVKFPRIH